MKHPIYVILNALSAGLRIPDKQTGLTYCFSDKNRLSVIMQTEQGEQCLELDFSFNSIMAWAEKMPEQELYSIAAAIAIQK